MSSPLENTKQLLDVSVTERGSFRTCRRRWYLTVIENLQPKMASELDAEFGTAVHSGLEAYYLTGDEGLAYQEVELWMDSACAQAEDSVAIEEIRHMADMGLGMLEYYFQYDRVAPVKLGRPIAVEGNWLDQEWITPQRPKGYPASADVHFLDNGRMMVPIVDPDTKEPLVKDGQVVYLTCRIDVLTERKTPKKGLWVDDHKTAKSSPSDQALDLDDQATGYCYAVWRWTGYVPRGVILNYLIKKLPKPPRIVRQTKANPSGLSTAKDQLTTPDMYRDALKEYGLLVGGKIVSEDHATCMSALLARGWDPFFRRFEITRNFEQMANFERRLAAEYDDMVDAVADVEYLYPNPDKRWCGFCPVRRICLALEDGSDVDYVLEHQYTQGPDRKAIYTDD